MKNKKQSIFSDVRKQFANLISQLVLLEQLL